MNIMQDTSKSDHTWVAIITWVQKHKSNKAKLKTFVHETVPGFMKGGKQNAENLVSNMIQTLKDKGVSLSESRSYKVDSTVNMVGI